jgi:hypothetical protein
MTTCKNIPTLSSELEGSIFELDIKRKNPSAKVRTV